MSAAKVAKSAQVSKSVGRKTSRRGIGTKHAAKSADGGLVDKRSPRRTAERDAAPGEQAATTAKRSVAVKQEGPAMSRHAAHEAPPNEKSAMQDIRVAEPEHSAQDDTEASNQALDRETGADSTLSKYFREMAQHRVL